MSNRQVIEEEDENVHLEEGEELVSLDGKPDRKATPQKSDAKPETVAPELPEKYKGKSAEELIRMHQEAEKLLGKQGSELGELRKLSDEFIKSTLEKQTKDNAPAERSAQAEEEIDFFANPEKAIERIIDKHPKLKGTAEHLEMLERTEKIRNLEAKYPGYMETVKSPEFQEWATATRMRQQLLVEADTKWNIDAAEELLANYTALKGSKKDPEEKPETRETRRSSPRDMQTVPSGAMTPSAASLEGSKKIYRRADIIKLMQTDPDRYEMMQDEILAAYREKRVR